MGSAARNVGTTVGSSISNSASSDIDIGFENDDETAAGCDDSSIASATERGNSFVASFPVVQLKNKLF